MFRDGNTGIQYGQDEILIMHRILAIVLLCASTSWAGVAAGNRAWPWFVSKSSYVFPQAAKIVLKWEFASNANPTPDTSAVGTNSGTVNSATWDSANGGKYFFDGINDTITNANVNLADDATGITVSVWTYQTTNTQYAGLVSTYTDTGGNSGWIIDVRDTAGTQPGFVVFDVDGQVSLGAGAVNDLPRNGWHHVVGTWNKISGDIHIYVDAVDKTASPTENADNNLNQTRGMCLADDFTSPGRFWDGYIAQIVVWKNWTAGSSDVTNIYNGTKGPY